MLQRGEAFHLRRESLSLRDEPLRGSDARLSVRDALLSENRQRFPLTDLRLSVRDSLLSEMGSPLARNDARLSVRDSLVGEKVSRFASTDVRLSVEDAPLHVRPMPLWLRRALVGRSDAPVTFSRAFLSDARARGTEREAHFSENRRRLAQSAGGLTKSVWQ
jgi:hypothetical protein